MWVEPAQPDPLHTVRPTPVRSLTSTPSTVTEQVTSWPMFTMVTLAFVLPDAAG